MSGVSLTLDPVPASVPAARRWLGDHLALRPEYALEPALLCLSELVTNALLHARTVITINLVERDSTLRVEVVDSGDVSARGRIFAEDRDAESGRGLQLVSMLSASHGIGVNDDGPGLTAWFELAADLSAGERRRDVSA